MPTWHIVKKSLRRTVLLLLACGCLLAASGGLSSGAPPAYPVQLSGRYVDWAQQEVPFGSHSYHHAPWRAYMDTWDTSRLLDALGVVFNPAPAEAEATARLLAEAGIVSARVEIGWGALDYEDDRRLRPQQEQDMRIVLGALRKHGIRPLILLNSHSGMPAPGKTWQGELSKPAKAGDRVVYLADAEGVVPRYTGFSGIAQFMYPVITAIDVGSGRAELSAPLPHDLPAGRIELAQLRYEPFSGERLADGSDNPAARKTLDGWMRYVRTVTGFVREAMATDDPADAGFDLEVWNELSFGYHFLDINHYYDPPLVYSEELSYTDGDNRVQGPQVILPLTAAYIADPAHRLPGVRVINGFANQRPWDNGTVLWPGQSGFSRHYYTGWDAVGSQIGEDNRTLKRDAMLDMLGRPDPEGYIPPHVSAFPERWYYAYQTEFVVRDLQPFPGPWKDHYRFSHPGDGVAAEVWMTESNLYRGQFAKELARLANVGIGDPRLSRVMHRLAAKSTLRNYLFQSHKGVQRIYLYAAKGKDSEFALLPEAYYEALRRSGYRLTPAVRRAAGPQLQALGNLVRELRSGERIEQPRFLDVERIASSDETVAYSGDGRDISPDRYLVEDMAVLPYQLGDRKYAVAYYIVTRDVTASWDESRQRLDPQRYDMPERMVEVKLSNVAGRRAEVEVYDPITDARTTPQVTEASSTTLTVRLPVTDSPRLLLIEEAQPQPLIVEPELTVDGEAAVFSFVPTVSGEANISWGPYPWRVGGGFQERFYAEDQPRRPATTRSTDRIGGELPARAGTYEWAGIIAPEQDGRYTFLVDASSCQVTLRIDGHLVVSGCDDAGRGELELEAGRRYEVRATYSSKYKKEQHMDVYWAAAQQPREALRPAADPEQQRTLQVSAGERVELHIPELPQGSGVTVDYRSEDGIRTRYPEWDYDVRGVRWR